MPDPDSAAAPAAPESPSFETVALERGFVTQAQLDECREIRRKVIEAGLETTVEEVLLKKGYLTKPQSVAIQAALGKGVRAVIEGYTILEKIAQGGMGAVYKARQTSMDRIVALKILLPKFAKEKDAVDRFVREAKAIAKLSHPNIVGGIDAGVSNGIYYYAMEFIDGESMDKVVKRNGPLHWSEALPIAQQVAAALDHANGLGFVHRDIKPGNILRLKDGTVKLADLGLARAASGDDIYVTRTGVILGTPAYLSPEQARSERLVDIRSDIYSLGVTLYELLYGRPPFDSDNALVVVTKHTTADVPVQRLVERMVPDGVVEVVRKMCARDRRARYQLPGDLLEDLGLVLRGEPPVHAARPVSAIAQAVQIFPIRPRERAWVGKLLAIATAVMLLAVCAGLAYVVLKSGNDLPVKPGKTPDPGPSPAEKRAAVEIDDARQYESANEGRLEEILSRWRTAVTVTEGTSVEGEARQRVETLLRKIEGAKKTTEDELDRRVKECESARKFGDALAAIRAAFEKFSEEGWRRRMNEKSDASAARARDWVDGVLLEANAAARNMAFDSALAKLEITVGIAALDAAIATRRAEIEKARDAARPPVLDDKEVDARRLAEAVPRLLATAKGRDFEAAAKSADTLADALKTLDGKAEAQRYVTWMNACHKLLRTAGDSLSRLRAAEKVSLELRGGTKVEGTVVTASKASVVVRDKYDRTVALAELSVASLVWLYERPIDGKTATADRRAPALIAILEGDAKGAAKYMDIVLRAGYEVPERILAAYKDLKKE